MPGRNQEDLLPAASPRILCPLPPGAAGGKMKQRIEITCWFCLNIRVEGGGGAGVGVQGLGLWD